MLSTKCYLLSGPEIFSESLLWKLQRSYFEDMGFEAWRQGDVPHQVTSNTYIANSYAEIIFTFYREWQLQHETDGSQPLYIIETGAGSGRFAFHLLSRLHSLCDQLDLPVNSFKYVLTDFTVNNLEFWRNHLWFRYFFECGMLDVALLDMAAPGNLELQVSGIHIAPGALHLPLIAMANYVFDSVPQDLFKFENKQVSRGMLSLIIQEYPAQMDTAEILAGLNCNFEYEVISDTVYNELWLQQLLDFYTDNLNNTHLLLPAVGLRCIHHLKSFSQQGLVLLSADKGIHCLEALHNRPQPGLVKHGSFSLNVNYHAFKYYCEQQGGIALFTGHNHQSLNVCCLLLLPNAAKLKETIFSYRRLVQDFGPDDFFTIAKHSRQYMSEMTAADILAYLRLSHYDSQQLSRYLPRLIELADDLTTAARTDIKNSINSVWQQYFPIGEQLDLANAIARYFYKVDEYELALAYFQESVNVYGNDSGTLYNMAVCYAMMDNYASACNYLEVVLQHDPDNKGARVLLADYSMKI